MSNRPVSTQQAEAMFAGSSPSGVAGGAPATIPSLPPKASKAPPSIFDNTSGNAGGFEQAGIGGIGPFSNITINMDAGLVSSPATVGQDIIDAILAAHETRASCSPRSMTVPTIQVLVGFQTTTGFGSPFQLDDAYYGVLDTAGRGTLRRNPVRRPDKLCHVDQHQARTSTPVRPI